MIKLNDITNENEKVRNLLIREEIAIKNKNQSELEIFKTFKEIIDPELKINIFDLGLVYDFKLNKNSIYIEMTLTNPMCPMSDFFIREIKNKFLKLNFIKKVNLKFVWEPVWNPQNLPIEIRAFLNI